MIQWARQLRSIGLAMAVIAASIVTASSQDYPSEPIRIIVPTPPGGMSDLISRTFATAVTERTGHPVVVENRTGAGGVIAANYVAQSKPDGYTIYLGFHGTQSILQHLQDLPYDPEQDFEPIVFLATGPNVLVVHPSVPAKSVQELIELAKKKPGELSYGTAGVGTSPHLIAEQFKLHAGVDISTVHYRGAAPARQDLLGGHLPLMFDLLINAMGNVGAGELRALAITAAERSPLLPDVPTMAEVGLPEVEAGAWFAFFAPAGTPRTAIDWLNKQANEIFSSPEMMTRFQKQGMDLPLGSPDQLQAHVDADRERWREVIQRAGIKLD